MLSNIQLTYILSLLNEIAQQRQQPLPNSNIQQHNQLQQPQYQPQQSQPQQVLFPDRLQISTMNTIMNRRNMNMDINRDIRMMNMNIDMDMNQYLRPIMQTQLMNTAINDHISSNLHQVIEPIHKYVKENDRDTENHQGDIDTKEENLIKIEGNIDKKIVEESKKTEIKGQIEVESKVEIETEKVDKGKRKNERQSKQKGEKEPKKWHVKKDKEKKDEKKKEKENRKKKIKEDEKKKEKEDDKEKEKEIRKELTIKKVSDEDIDLSDKIIPSTNNSLILGDSAIASHNDSINDILPMKSASKKIKKLNKCGNNEELHYAKSLCYDCYHKYGSLKKPWKCDHEILYAKGFCQPCYVDYYNRKRLRLGLRKKRSEGHSHKKSIEMVDVTTQTSFIYNDDDMLNDDMNNVHYQKMSNEKQKQN